MAVDLAAKRAASRAKRGLDAPVVVAEPAETGLEDFELPTIHRSSDDVAIDAIIDGLDIVDFYQRWCSKEITPGQESKRESIMCRCPRPDHDDVDPSAWMNRDNNLGHCGCGRGFDRYMIAGWHFDLDPKTQFVALRTAIAADMGYVVKKDITGKSYVEGPVVADAGDTPAIEAPESTVVDLPTAAAVEWRKSALEAPAIDWSAIIPSDSFVARWMRATADHDLPSEFFFWTGLQMVGLAAGRTTVLADKPEVRGNLFLCLYGPSGIGKTRSVKVALDLLTKALPYDRDDADCKGTMLVPMPGSAEALIDSFSKPIVDDITGKTTYAGVRGLIRFDELSNLIGRANRVGNVMKPYLMELYDAYSHVDIVSRGAGYTKADNFFAAATTSTQPGAIRELLTHGDTDSGFLNRWVFVAGPAKKLSAYGGHDIDIEPLVLPLKELRNWSELGHTLVLEGAALEVWNAFFYREIEPLIQKGAETLTTRAALTLKKLIVLFCINEQKSEPDAGLVDRVCSLWPYLRATYAAVQNEVGANEFDDIREAVLSFVPHFATATGRPPTISDVNRGLPRRLPRMMFPKVLGIMASLGEITTDEKTAINGRKSTIIELGEVA